MNEPRNGMQLSFAIPAYNEEQHIGRCIEAIERELARTPTDAEIIVVDNASTDHTQEAALRYAGVRVVSEPRKGITWARERGFREATGDLVANIDADNLLTPGWIATVLREFAANPNLVCLSGPFLYHDLPLHARIITRLFYLVGFPFYLVNRFVFRIGSIVQGGNFVVRRTALERAGGFNTSIDFYGEDTDVACRLSKVGDVKFTFRLPILSSGRRMAQEGLIATGARYAVNYLWVTFTGKPFTRHSRDVRRTTTP